MEKEQLVSLVTKAQQGDNEALNCLFNEFYNDLYYFALKTVKDDETALDVTQEAFVEIINTLGNLKEPAAFVTWAKQITYHQCTRYFKKKKDVLVDEDEEGNTVFDTLKEEKAEFIPDEALDKADFKKTVMGILDELSEEQRSAVMMYYFDEMSVKQIAEIQGVSEGTVKSRLNYARKAIKNSVEEYEKKHNIKLHAIPFFPFLKWIFDGMFEGSIPTASAEIIAEGVATATGTTVTVATTTATATTVATTTTAGAVGLGAKIAAMPIATKIIAGVVAAAIVIGGSTTAVLLSQKDNTPTSADSQIDYSYRTEYMTSWNYEQALNYYHGWLNDFDMPYFNSVDELSVDVAVRFGYSEWAGTNAQGEWEMDSIIGDQKALLRALFGREFDFTKLTGEYATYNAEKGIVTVNEDENYVYTGDYSSDSSQPIDNGDGTYSIIIRDYRNKVKELPNDVKEGEYVSDEEGYYLLTHSGRLTIEKKDGFWVLKSYTKTDLQSGDGSSSEATTGEGSSSNNNDTTDETSTPTTSTSSPSTPSNTVTKIDFSRIENSNRLCALLMTDTKAKSLTANAIIHYYLEEICLAIGGGDISAETVYDTVSENFVVDNSMKELLKTSSYYNSASNSFVIENSKYNEYYNGRSNCNIKGYTDLGSDKYTIYSSVVDPNLEGIGVGSGETYYFKAEITYTDTKFIIHTFETITSIPNDISTID